MKSAYYVWVNGQFVGFTEDAKTNAEFDLTPYVKVGKNTLAVKVYRFSNGSYFECQDFWRLSGIERDVVVYSKPTLYKFQPLTTFMNSYAVTSINVGVMATKL